MDMVSVEVLRWNHPLVLDSEEDQYSVTLWSRPDMLLAPDPEGHRGGRITHDTIVQIMRR